MGRTGIRPYTVKGEKQFRGSLFEWRDSTRPLELTLDSDIRDRITLRRGKRGKQIRHQPLKVDQPVGSGSRYDDGDFEGWKILLKREIAIDVDEDFKLLRCERKQFSV